MVNLNQDFREFIGLLESEGVSYLIVGIPLPKPLYPHACEVFAKVDAALRGLKRN